MNSKNLNSCIDVVKKQLSEIELKKSFFSLTPFQSVSEALVVCGSYTVAALLIPQIINLALGSLIGILAFAGLVAVCYGGYQWYKTAQNHETAAENESLFVGLKDAVSSSPDNATKALGLDDPKFPKNITLVGAGALVLSMSMSFSAILLPMILTAIAGHRVFSAMTSDHWDSLDEMRDSFTSLFSKK